MAYSLPLDIDHLVQGLRQNCHYTDAIQPGHLTPIQVGIRDMHVIAETLSRGRESSSKWDL